MVWRECSRSIRPSAPGDNRLRIGMTGTGVGVLTGPPGSGISYPVHGSYPPTVGGIEADIALAQENDILLVWSLVGSRNHWAPDGLYDPALYETRTRRFTVAGGASASTAAAVTAALQDDPPRAVIVILDEPNHAFFDDINGDSTITPTAANDMGLLVKSIWPGAYTYIRAPSLTLAVDGWDNVDDEAVPPAGGWTGVDFGFTHYNAFGNETPAFRFERERDEFAAVDLGQLMGLNYINGGLEEDMDGIAACWDGLNNGSSSGVIVSTLGHNETVDDGEFLTCGSPSIGAPIANQFVAGPEWREHVATVMASYSHVPFAVGFGLSGPNAPDSLNAPWAIALDAREDIVASMVNSVNIGLARATFDGWPVAK